MVVLVSKRKEYTKGDELEKLRSSLAKEAPKILHHRNRHGPDSRGGCPHKFLSSFRKFLLFLFLYIAAFGLGFLDDLFLELAGDYVIVVHFHVEGSAALGH